jgi:NADP-reducing hydrogenase subunit HndB
MAKLSLAKLKKMRETLKKEQGSKAAQEAVLVLVGMGTCGVAAGANEVLKAFQEEIEKKGLTNVVIKQTGCLGLCSVEPTVEIVMPDMPRVIYGDVTAEVARDIVFKHIVSKKLVNEHIYDRPVKI